MDALRDFETVTAAFERELARATLDAPLSAIRWTVRDLAAHLGEVHRWVVGNVATGHRGQRENVPALTMPPLEWYASSRRLLLDQFAAVPASQDCWTMSQSDRTVGFWHRRQLHESLVHLWDLRSADGPGVMPPAEVSPETHADGIDELFDVFLPRSSEADRTPLGGTLRVEATDIDRAWIFADEWGGTPAEPSAIVRGTAGDLLLFAWNRRTVTGGVMPTRLHLEGSVDVVEGFRRARVRP
jgi:uncharacterized protein (TIGR03083 family)